MWHLCAYSALTAAAVTNNDTPALQDDIITIQNNHFLLPYNMNVAAAYASGVALTRARINSPTVRQMNPGYVHPINVALLPANDPNVQVYPPGFLALMGQEEVQFEITDSQAAGERIYGLLWLYTQLQAIPPGDIHWCRLTSTVTHTASVWTTIAYTLETGLPPGEYTMISSFVQNTTGIAHRWIFDNQYLRPGFLSTASLANRINREAYTYEWGRMGAFRTFSLPRLQVLSNAADTAAEAYIALVRTGA